MRPNFSLLSNVWEGLYRFAGFIQGKFRWRNGRRSDELGEDSSEDEGDLVLFSDSDSLSAERILREEGGEFTSESEDLDGDFDDDEGDERQERGLDWELEEDKILPTRYLVHVGR